ncbi:MAG: precorrin-2 C(20)-methyltransferase [Alphaproteobacteria bacterium]|nr:MAG: precorrin-2 C(20)-methyltransferase [Alphaproteobacteria bacterium]
MSRAGATDGAGRLWGVGLGPGDPELLTLKAHRVIRAADVVAYPALPHGDSLARRIAAAADAIAPGSRELPITVPMTRERAPAQAAYDRAAEAIAAELAAGRRVVVLCEGDPFLYGSFMYLHARLAGRFAVEVIPGVTSVSAAAARAGRPLVARNEVLTLLPATLGDAALAARLAGAEAAAILKLGRHLPRLRALLERLGLAARTLYVERVSMAGAERILPLAEAPEAAPYFSLLLVSKGADPWL